MQRRPPRRSPRRRGAPCRSSGRRSRPRLEVALEDLADAEAAERLALVAGELDHVALGGAEVGGERDRDRPVLAVGERHRPRRRSSSPRSPGAGERGEAAVADQLEVGGLAVGELQLELCLGHGGVGVVGRRAIGSVRKAGRVATTCDLSRGAALGLLGVRPAARPGRPRRRPASGCSACSRSTDSPGRAAGCRGSRARRCRTRPAPPTSRRAGSASRGRSACPSRTSAPRPRLRVLAADPRDPEVDGGERRAHRLDLADPAAGVGVAAPELVAVEPLCCSSVIEL